MVVGCRNGALSVPGIPVLRVERLLKGGVRDRSQVFRLRRTNNVSS